MFDLITAGHGWENEDSGCVLTQGSSQLDIRKNLITVRITLGTGCPEGQQNLSFGGFQDLTEQSPGIPGVNSTLTLL